MVVGLSGGVTIASAQVQIDAPSEARVVLGDTVGVSAFDLTNLTAEGVGFDATLSPDLSYFFQPLDGVRVDVPNGDSINGLLPGGGRITGIIGYAGAPAETVAGDIVDVTLSLTPFGGDELTRTTATTFVNNRTLTGSFTLNQGRHIFGSLGTLELNGGVGTTADTADVTVRGNQGSASGHARVQGATGGVYLSSSQSTDFTFNGADQTLDLTVTPANLGFYQVQTTLPGPGAGIGFAGQGGSNGTIPLITTEDIAGADLDLSGVTLNVSGVAVTDRRLTLDNAGQSNVRLLRAVAGTAEEPVIIDFDHVQRIETSGSRDIRTDLRLNTFEQTVDTITARLDTAQDFTSDSDFAEVQIVGSVVVDPNAVGRQATIIDITDRIEALENLEGQSIQSALNVSASYSVLDDNAARGEDTVIYRYDDAPSVAGLRFQNDSVGREFSTSTHTAIQIDDTFVAGPTGSGTVTLTAGDGIIGEGLEGEVVQESFEYGYRTRTIKHANVDPVEGPLSDGDTLVLENRGVIDDTSQADAAISLRLRGQTADFQVGRLGGPVNEFGFVRLGDSVQLASGEDTDLEVRYLGPTTNVSVFDREFRASLTATISDSFSASDSATLLGPEPGTIDDFGFDSDTIGERSTQRVWEIVERIEAEASDEATDTLVAGRDFGEESVGLTSLRGSVATVIDSLEIGSSIDLSIAFTEATANPDAQQTAAAGYDDIIGDVVSLTGLDGELHVLQLTVPAPGSDTDPREGAAIQYFYQDAPDDPGDLSDTIDNPDAWINAVLGNSDVLNLDLDAGTLQTQDLVTEELVEQTIDDYLESRYFDGSYVEYLLSAGLANPELGVFGYDAQRDLAWAVIDHNTEFGVIEVIPEPSVGLMLAGGLGLLRRRRSA